MAAPLTNFRYGPILGLHAEKKQHGFFTVSSLNLIGREILGNLNLSVRDVPEQVYDLFAVTANPGELSWFFERQLKVAASFDDGVTNWVNLVPRMLECTAFIESVEPLLIEKVRWFPRVKYKRRVENVGFEVVEQGALSDTAFAFLHRLIAAGYPVALDDVGAPDGAFATGALVTDVLRRLPVSKLKIDRSLIQGRGPEQAAEAVIEFLTTIHPRYVKSVKEVTIEGVPVNPHADDLKAEMFRTERAQQLFANYTTNATMWRFALHDLEHHLHMKVNVQLAPVVYADFEQVTMRHVS